MAGDGYEFLDASLQWDLVVTRDVYGQVIREFWGDKLFGEHPKGIRITLIDYVTHPDCVSPYVRPAMAPIQLTDFWASYYKPCDQYTLGYGLGADTGDEIWLGCVWGGMKQHYDPLECFMAVEKPGPHLNDIATSGSIIAYNFQLTIGIGAEWPNFAGPPFTPLMGVARREGDQWRWEDPFLRIVPADPNRPQP